MKIVCISDTHTLHKQLVVPECDMLIHAGDLSHRGSGADTWEFLSWFTALPVKYKVFIAGNHDLCLDPKFNSETQAHLWVRKMFDTYRIDPVEGPGTYYLDNNSVTIEGIKLWGSGITPDFHPKYWALNRPRGADIAAVWEHIPLDTHIVVTHGPVYGVLDYIPDQQFHAGCEDLRSRLEVVRPLYHICGHIHEGYGLVSKEHTTYINASVCDIRYRPINPPIEIKVY